MSGHDLDLPFEEIPGGPVAAPLHPDALVCGGVVIRASVLETDAGRLPALIFDFYGVTGVALPPVVLTSDDVNQLRKLVPLVEASVAAAARAVS